MGVIKRNDLTKYIKLLTFQWTRFNKAERAKLQAMSGWSLQFDENYLSNRKGQFFKLISNYIEIWAVIRSRNIFVEASKLNTVNIIIIVFLGIFIIVGAIQVYT